jgi:hypothetical protein
MANKESFPEIRESVRKLCARFPGEYWRKLHRAFGGSELGPDAAGALLEEIHRYGEQLAWEGTGHVTTVLHALHVKSPRDAVRAVIAAEYKAK